MRTTVTLDPDVVSVLQERMRTRGVSFKQALNDVIREGAHRSLPGERPFQTPTANLGVPTVNLDRALQLASELEDEELVRKARSGR